MSKYPATIMALLIIAMASVAAASTYELTWNTIDAGGGVSTGGNFVLSGTIGQHDAGESVGADFVLIGGYQGPVASICSCPGDLNGDHVKNGADLQQFATCLVQGVNCGCAEIDGAPGLDANDIQMFVTDLLSGGVCP